MRRTFSVAIVAIACLAVAPAAAGWVWPADGAVLRPFSVGADTYAAGQHRGIDVAGSVGDPVRAPAAGAVSFAGAVPGGGRAVTIQTADGHAVTLLQLGAVVVARGSSVAEGAVVGEIGQSEDGVTAAPHVHLGIRLAAEPDGYIDPEGLLPVRGVPAPAPEPAPVAAPDPAVAAPAPPAPVQPVAAPVHAEPAASAPAIEPALVAEAQPARAPTPRAAASPKTAAGAEPAEASPRPVVRARTVTGASERRPEPRTPTPAPGPVAAATVEADVPRTPALRRAAPAAPARAAVQLRAFDRVPPPAAVVRDPVRPAAIQARNRSTSADERISGSLLLLAGLAVAAAIAAQVARKAAPIIEGDELLPDNTHLLRQLDAAHRPRVHDDRGRHPRPPSQAAGGGDVFPDRRRRARRQGGPCRGGGGAHAAGVRRPDRAGLARARPERQRRARLLHPDDR